MTSLIQSSGCSLALRICGSCRRSFHTTRVRLQDTTPMTSPTQSISSADISRRPQPYDDSLSQLVARLASRTNAAPPSRLRLPHNTDAMITDLLTRDRQKLQLAGTRNPNNAAMVDAARAVGYKKNAQDQLDSMQLESDLRRRLGRYWRNGDVYAPQDLGPREQKNWLKRQMARNTTDVFELIGKKPTQFYRVITKTVNLVNEC